MSYHYYQELIRANTAYQEYCEEESHREHVFASVRRWIYSHDLGIGLHGICDGNAKEGGLAPETDKQGGRVIGNVPLEAPWQFRAQVLSSFILCLQLSTTCNNEGCDKSRHHKCANCKLAFYCCKDCQVEDWSARHKRVCKCIANEFVADETTLTANLRAYEFLLEKAQRVDWLSILCNCLYMMEESGLGYLLAVRCRCYLLCHMLFYLHFAISCVHA